MMTFETFSPSNPTGHFIENYWIITGEANRTGDDLRPTIEKIIPDGFPEIIFHYGDPYCINWHDEWVEQPKQLLAGQIKKYFFLKNTGTSGIIGIKCKPSALTALFGLDMSHYTDKVVDLYSVPEVRLPDIQNIAHIAFSDRPVPEKIGLIDDQLKNLIASSLGNDPNPADGPVAIDPLIEKAVDLIFRQKGLVTIAELCAQLFITERQMERLFKKNIGLPPKFYARIIRFNYIFSLIREKQLTWNELALQSGYYDASHFVRNFKSFTGEDPSRYEFGDDNLANFFLLRKHR